MISTPKEKIEEVCDKPFCCKFCGSENYIKYGKKKGTQNYMCKDCGRKFVNNTHFEHMKANVTKRGLDEAREELGPLAEELIGAIEGALGYKLP